MSKTKSKFWSFKSLDNKTGELSIYGEISDFFWWGDEVVPSDFKKELDALGNIDILNVYINSPGGDVFAGQTIYTILKRHVARVHIYIDGLAASIASVIAMAGDKITMPKNAMMMVHNPSMRIFGNATELREAADTLEKVLETMLEAYLGKVSIKKDKLIELLDAETWLSADECKEYGFIDEVEDFKQIAACVDKEVLARYKNVPEDLLSENLSPEDKTKDKEQDVLKQKLSIELEL